jgi:hypothetical protein
MSTALAREERHAITAQPTVMEILSSAVLSGKCDVDIVERLTRMQREQVEYQAAVEFNEAMQRAQSKMKRVGADATNPQTHSKYATYAKLDGALRPIYSEEGFSLSFNSGEPLGPEMVRVLCYVSRGGHTRTYQYDVPADGKGAKGNDVMTKTHAVGAAASYGMRYLLKMIFNVAVGETDDDGNCDGIGDTEVISWVDNIGGAQDEEDLKKFFNAAYQEAVKAKDKDALQTFRDARDKRRKELSL